ASLYLDDEGWTIERKRAWMAVMCGSHYDFIDFSIQIHLESGTEESRNKIRNWMKHLSEFTHSFDFIHAGNTQNWIVSKPEHCVSAGLAVEGRDYVVYTADSRELGESGAGSSIRGELSLRLPAGKYTIRQYSPASGGYVHSGQSDGGEVRIALESFEH